MQQNAAEILAKRGFRSATVETARRFYNGQIEPNEFMPSMMRLAGAYYHRPGPLLMTHEILKVGMRTKARPEAQIFAFGQLLKGWTVMDRLGEIQVPTLVLAGRDDFQFPPEHQAELAAGIPNAQLEIIERAGHNAPTERPDQIIQAVRELLAAATLSGTQSLGGAEAKT